MNSSYVLLSRLVYDWLLFCHCLLIRYSIKCVHGVHIIGHIGFCPINNLWVGRVCFLCRDGMIIVKPVTFGDHVYTLGQVVPVMTRHHPVL